MGNTGKSKSFVKMEKESMRARNLGNLLKIVCSSESSSHHLLLSEMAWPKWANQMIIGHAKAI